MEYYVDIIIDEITPCLRDRRTNELLNTRVVKVEGNMKRLSKRLLKSGWNFNWYLPYKDGFDIYALKLEDDEEIQGMIAVNVNKKEKYVEVELVESAPENISHLGKYEGVGGNLFAFACQMSFDYGLEGYVTFTAKTNLIEHYMKRLGARRSSFNNLFIDTKNAIILIEEHLNSKEE